jgi:hypothetical protein
VQTDVDASKEIWYLVSHNGISTRPVEAEARSAVFAAGVDSCLSNVGMSDCTGHELNLIKIVLIIRADRS